MYCTVVGYIWYEAPAEMNFITLLELIDASEARGDDEYQAPEIKSAVCTDLEEGRLKPFRGESNPKI